MTIDNFTEYAKQDWKNKPDTSTPVSAERLLHMEDGIKNVSDAIKAIADAVYDEILNDPNKIASLAALYSLKQEVDKKVATPATAVVGQILEVAEVDANGVPTKFKAVDNKGGGAGDWNVNDEDVDGFIKNRTHWKELISEYAEILPETAVEFTTNMTTVTGIGTDSGIIVGNTYVVNWSGTEYECAAFKSGSIMLGNAALLSSGDDTGEPFCIELFTATTSYVVKATEDAETVNLSVNQPEKIVYHTIDPGYLPDGIGGGASSWNDLTDKPFYTEYGEVEIFPETTLSFSENDGVYMSASDITMGLEIGKTYTVNWNGVAYNCVATNDLDIFGAGTKLGNDGIFGGTDIGEPFLLFDLSGTPFEGELGKAVFVTGENGDVPVSVLYSGEIVYPIEEKYIPNTFPRKQVAYTNALGEAYLYFDKDCTQKMSMTDFYDFFENGGIISYDVAYYSPMLLTFTGTYVVIVVRAGSTDVVFYSSERES